MTRGDILLRQYNYSHLKLTDKTVQGGQFLDCIEGNFFLHNTLHMKIYLEVKPTVLLFPSSYFRKGGKYGVCISFLFTRSYLTVYLPSPSTESATLPVGEGEPPSDYN